MSKNKVITGIPLFQDRWELTHFEEHQEEIRQAAVIAWKALNYIDNTYEYVSIMKCAFHLIALFVEDYPHQYDPGEIAVVAVKLAYINLSQGREEEVYLSELTEILNEYDKSHLRDIEFEMLRYPLNRCFSLMETEFKPPDVVYNEALQLLHNQLGPYHIAINKDHLQRIIHNYYKKIDKMRNEADPIDLEPYVPIGGSPSFSKRSPTQRMPQYTAPRLRTRPFTQRSYYPPYAEEHSYIPRASSPKRASIVFDYQQPMISRPASPRRVSIEPSYYRPPTISKPSSPRRLSQFYQFPTSASDLPRPSRFEPEYIAEQPSELPYQLFNSSYIPDLSKFSSSKR